MRHFLTILTALLICAAPLHAQVLKSLMYNTTNGFVTYSGTNTLRFNNAVSFDGGPLINSSGVFWADLTAGINLENGFINNLDGTTVISWGNDSKVTFGQPIFFNNATNAATTRANLGFSTNLNTLWTATNASNARSAVGLGWSALTNTNTATSLLGFTTNGQVVANTGTNTLRFTNSVSFDGGPFINASGVFWGSASGGGLNLEEQVFTDQGQNNVFSWSGGSGIMWYQPFEFYDNDDIATTRANLGLGATNIVTFAGITNNGDIRINQTTPTNGLLFVYRTNNEPFLGLANLIASNNTTLSNETLFRVGRAEATNQAAQFGFRVVRTNNGGEGFATFSVFGYNALMMIGPSDRSRTNTATNAGIEADIYTITGSNRVMTLRDTNTGALTMHQDIGFGADLTNNAPTNTNTPAIWLRVWVGTNNYRLPLYQ